MNQLNNSVLICLQHAKGTGKFASIQSTNFILPGLIIDANNEVSFPISEIQAKELIKLAEKSPFGKGALTIVDINVRSSWEIDANRIEIKNPQWNSNLSTILKKVKYDLGLENYEIEAHLHKLLIYEKGDFFLTHKDSEKEKGMFGSLIINLPSTFTGGELSVRFDGEEITTDFANNDNFSLSSISFYADCDHEVKPLTSGYRICLTYNLIQKSNGEKVTLLSTHKQINELANVFQKYPSDKPLIILLGHQYTPENFLYENLKLNDRYKAEIILKSAKQLGWYAKLCLVTSFLEGSPKYNNWDYENYDENESTELDEVFNETLIIEHWLENDSPILDQLNFEENDMISTFKLNDDEPIIKESSGYMGNYGPDVMHWYHYGSIVVWTPKQNAQLLPNQSIEVILNWINYFNHTRTVTPIEIECINHIISTYIFNESNIKKANYNVIVDWLIIQKNSTLLLTIDYKQLQFLIIHIDTIYWQKIMEILQLKDCRELLMRFTKEINSKTIEKLLEIIYSTNKSSKTIDLAIEQTMLLSSYLEIIDHFNLSSSALTNLIRIESEINFQQSKAFLKEYNLNQIDKNQWIDSVYKAMIKHLKWEYIHHVFAPLLLADNHSSKLKDNFLSFCFHYLQERVNNLPHPPVDWKRLIPENPRDKAMWKILKSFMDSPELEIFDFKKTQIERTQMENAIRNEKVDLKTETIKKGSPYTLRIIKTQKDYEYRLSNWNKDANLLTKILKKTGN